MTPVRGHLTKQLGSAGLEQAAPNSSEILCHLGLPIALTGRALAALTEPQISDPSLGYRMTGVRPMPRSQLVRGRPTFELVTPRSESGACKTNHFVFERERSADRRIHILKADGQLPRSDTSTRVFPEKVGPLLCNTVIDTYQAIEYLRAVFHRSTSISRGLRSS